MTTDSTSRASAATRTDPKDGHPTRATEER